MSNSENSLVLLTAEYPYGNKSETFLEQEIKYLSEGFSTIYIIPSAINPEYCRPLPDNVHVLNCLEQKGNKTRKAIATSYFFEILWIFLKELMKHNNLRPYLAGYKTYLDILIAAFNKYELLCDAIEKHNLKEAIFYDYWFQNSTVALALLKRKRVIDKVIARAHRYDLYDENDRPVPYRHFLVETIDKVLAISRHGASYLKNKCPRHSDKIEVSYLGVKIPNKINPGPNEGEKVIISVSSLYPFKRVEYIPLVLRHLDIPVKWIHFGSGVSKEKVLENAYELPSNVRYEMMGHVTNQDMLSFMKETPVDLFITLSSSEGLPVSIMEVMSYGIPVVATDVNAIPEIVNDKVGALVSLKDAEESIAQKITNVLFLSPNRSYVKEQVNLNFDAAKNFNNFIQRIKSYF